MRTTNPTTPVKLRTGPERPPVFNWRIFERSAIGTTIATTEENIVAVVTNPNEFYGTFVKVKRRTRVLEGLEVPAHLSRANLESALQEKLRRLRSAP